MKQIQELLEKAAEKQQQSLNEQEAKLFLHTYNIPVVYEVVVTDSTAAVSAAREIGFPVVLKGVGATLLHKTERGLVHLNLCGPDAVTGAVTSIQAEAGDELEGILVQPHLAGRREFVAGMFRDDLFGPVIMFGLGGVLTEALHDTSFRLAPLSDADATDMIAEIKSRELLSAFRGEAEIDRELLCKILLSLSRIAMQHTVISEIDINPLIALPNGSIQAVDALVCFSRKKRLIRKTPPVDPQALNRFFNPASIAFIGASSKFQKWGYLLPLSVLCCDYKGRVYMVNPGGGDIFGRASYRSVADIPDPIDLAVVTIPAAGVPDLIPQLQAKGVRSMLVVTSGFRETGSVGKKLEEELVKRAGEAGITVIGPNTMGICNPHISLACLPFPVKPRAGSTSLVCQSGNMGLQFLAFAEQQCIGIRSFCGSGNEAMVTIPDYLDALERDALTRIVMLYIEGIQDGRRFFESATRVSRRKPIVLLKGGKSRVGKRAASSHTGAIASDTAIFDAACRQAGVVQVAKSRTLLDVVAAFASQPVPRGNRVAIITLGGGWGVLTADLCASQGLVVPELSSDLIAHIDKVLPAFWSRANPVDIVATFGLETPTMLMEELLKWDGCDAVINLGILGKKFFFKRVIESAKPFGTISPEQSDQVLDATLKAEDKYIENVVSLIETYQKPIIGVSLFDEEKDRTIYPVGENRYKALFYPTPERAVAALAKMTDYGRFINACR